MNLIVYDFDKTIYGGETGINFFKFYRKKEKISLFYYMYFVFFTFLYLIRIINLKKLKEKFFVFIDKINIEKLEKLLEEFWRIEKYKMIVEVSKTIVQNKDENNKLICISASPEVFIGKFLYSLGFDIVIGTKFLVENKKFYSQIIGNNCKGKEKVERLKREFKDKNFKISKFYSDSYSDKPLFDLAVEKYYVKKSQIKAISNLD